MSAFEHDPRLGPQAPQGPDWIKVGWQLAHILIPRAARLEAAIQTLRAFEQNRGLQDALELFQEISSEIAKAGVKL